MREQDTTKAEMFPKVASGWQPMETAPLDGTPVLLWCERARDGGEGGAFHCGKDPHVVVARYEKREGGWVGDNILVVQGDEYTGAWTEIVPFGPDYWMPLPDPPPRLSRSAKERKPPHARRPRG